MPYNTTRLHFDYKVDLAAYWSERLRIIKDQGAIILTAQQPFATDLINSCRKYFRYEIIWEKTMKLGFLNAKKMPLRGHENILIFYKKLPVYHPQKYKVIQGGRSVTIKGNGNTYDGYGEFKRIDYKDDGTRYPHSVIRFSNGHSFAENADDHFHPTQKPLDLFRWLIRSYSSLGDLVFDGYSGSGTTAIACVLEKRKFISCETDPVYFQKSIERLFKFWPSDWHIKEQQKS
jgi:site-specific DNA-methyltransferase (adenine-specific)